MKSSRHLHSACHKKFSLFLLSMLVFASPAIQAIGIVYEATLTYDATLFADADYNIVVEGISNGTPFSLNNPLSGIVFDLSNLGDTVEVTGSGSARSSTNGDETDAGHSTLNMSLGITILGEESGPIQLETAKAIAFILMDIDADGDDAFARSNASINGPIQTLASNNCLSDTLFGDSLNGVDIGTSGAPCHTRTEHVFDLFNDGVPPPPPEGVVLGRENVTGDGQAFSSSADYTNTIGFTVQAVPLPSALWLFGTGLLGLIGMSKRKKAA